MICAEESSALSPGTKLPRISSRPSSAVSAPVGSFSTASATGRLYGRRGALDVAQRRRGRHGRGDQPDQLDEEDVPRARGLARHVVDVALCDAALGWPCDGRGALGSGGSGFSAVGQTIFVSGAKQIGSAFGSLQPMSAISTATDGEHRGRHVEHVAEAAHARDLAPARRGGAAHRGHDRVAVDGLELLGARRARELLESHAARVVGRQVLAHGDLEARHLAAQVPQRGEPQQVGLGGLAVAARPLHGRARDPRAEAADQRSVGVAAGRLLGGVEVRLDAGHELVGPRVVVCAPTQRRQRAQLGDPRERLLAPRRRRPGPPMMNVGGAGAVRRLARRSSPAAVVTVAARWRAARMRFSERQRLAPLRSLRLGLVSALGSSWSQPSVGRRSSLRSECL